MGDIGKYFNEEELRCHFINQFVPEIVRIGIGKDFIYIDII